MESRRELAWLIVALFFSCALALAAQGGLSEENLIWLEVFGGVTATVLLFIYKDRDKLTQLMGRKRPGTQGEISEC